MRGFSPLLLATAAAVSLACTAPEACAFETPEAGLAVAATPSVTSDYLFRSVGQTRGDWAGRFTLDVQHESGAHAGGFLRNAAFLASSWNDARQEQDLLAGCRFQLGGPGLDISHVGCFYPGSVFGTPDCNWYGIGVQREVHAGVTAALAWCGTDIDKGECAPVAGRADSGQGVCDDRLVLTVGRAF
jgi:hypothetical protein